MTSEEDRTLQVESSPAGGQEPPRTEPQAGTPKGQAPEGQHKNPNPGSETLSPDAAQKVITDLRAENAKSRIQLKELEDLRRFKAQVEEANLTEQQKTAAQVEALTNTQNSLTEALRTAKLETAVAVQAAGMNLVDPDVVLQLVDRSGIEFADDGTPNGDTVKQALTRLIEAKPFLAATTPPTSTGGATNPGRGGGMSITEVKAMTEEQLAALPPEQFMAVLAALGGSH